MEHLKLFSTRINIPRLIRVTEEYAHWKELVFLYVQVRLRAQREARLSRLGGFMLAVIEEAYGVC